MGMSKSTGYPLEERVGLAISIALHMLFLGFVLLSPAPRFPDSNVIDVTFETRSPPSTPRQQIVSPPQQRADKPPEHTDRLSDVDATAIKEQIKRGTEGGVVGPTAQKAEAQPQRKSSQRAEGPPQKERSKEPPERSPSPHKRSGDINLKDLKLDDATLAMKFGSPSKSSEQTKVADSSPTDLSKYAAFSRPPGSGATFVGSGGVSDHLPSLPDGDITLLNAKANTYAGFVRRVAVQVFAELRSQGWEQLTMGEVRQIGDFTSIEAILSPQGKFISLNLLGGSGSSSFDSVVQLSVRAGARDPNPPAGARAEDGNIHFIFKARSWASVGVSARSGGPVEHRWLLLATGLE